jgi:hypothetical protein
MVNLWSTSCRANGNTLGRYVQIREPLKASQAGNCVSKQVSYLVEDYYGIGEMCKRRKMLS